MILETLLLIIIICFLTFLLAVQRENGLKSVWVLKLGPSSGPIKLRKPSSFIGKRIGLLNHLSLPEDEGLLFKGASKIHTKGMCFSIDVIGLSKDLEVVFMRSGLKPENTLKIPPSAHYVVELNKGMILQSSLSLGESVELSELARV